MNFISLASSSKGNCYLLREDRSAPLLLEAGLSLDVIREKLREYDLSLSNIGGCLCSHSHGDHSKGIRGLLKAGIDCYMSYETARTLGVIKHHRSKIWDNYSEPFYISGASALITAFPVDHDADGTIGFVVSYDCDRLLFLPDSSTIQKGFSQITMIIAECNYVGDILLKNIMDGHIPAIVGKRIRQAHMGLETLISMLKVNDLSHCRAIYLMHLSSGNSDQERMKREIQESTGIPTYICEE